MRFRPLFVSSLVLFATTVSSAEQEVDHGKALVDWLRERNGYFNPKLEIRRAVRDDPTSFYGMFANEEINEKDVLLSIPRDCMVTSGTLKVGDDIIADVEGRDEWRPGKIEAANPDDLTFDISFENGRFARGVAFHSVRVRAKDTEECETTRNLIREMKLGDSSKFAPYVNYLLSQSPGQLPSAWSEAGKRLLLNILGNNGLGRKEMLPPDNVLGLSWAADCRDTEQEGAFGENAYMLLLQRGWDDVLIPVYDMMSHGNFRLLNTECDPVHTGRTVDVRASRKIQAGEQIYTTYNLCEDCGARATTYGTPELLRDYGFVEQYPQRWIFHDQRVAFDIDKISADSDELEVSWMFDEPDKDDIEFFEEQLLRLAKIKEEEFKESPQDQSMPQSEWDTIWQFHEALSVAMRQAVDKVESEFADQCLNGECKIASDRYDDLQVEEGPWDFNTGRVCDDYHFLSLPGHELTETVVSPYQEIMFYEDPSNKDVCFRLDKIVQICGSYRPHYHEMVVHYTARFLEDIKRVVWVGGGDSMLLHEIIKYPNLEFVVGLELDQQVTRKSFKHFGTQPHWDNEKVQWWYGDATKSLLMLPKEYFGTFDMVLVDLSETVMSLSVTDELDVMEAFALLLKPEGIFVKNELYLEKMSEMFDHTIQIHFYDVPVVCSQCLIMGSNSVDFLERAPKDHNLDNLYVTPLDTTKDQYDIIHDYRKRNHTGVNKYCKMPGEKEVDPVEQKRSPGILMIVEAEDATGPLEPSKKLKDVLVKALTKEGFNVLSTLAPASDDKNAVVVVVLREGYVVARTWPEHKYCAYDIHLWSSFEKHENVRKALIEAVGSPSSSSSSYRIVAGGMFGVSTWKDDEKNRGPKKTQFCDMNTEESSSHIGSMDQGLADSVLEGGLSLIQEDDVTVLVLCGDKGQPCTSLDALQKQSKIREAVSLWTCSSIENGQEYLEDGLQRMMACEEDVVKTVKETVTDETKIRAIVLDASATFEMARILLKIFSNKANKNELLTPDVTVMTAMEKELEPWRETFMQRFHRYIVRHEPFFRAEVEFNSIDSSMVMDVVSSDVLFFQHLVDMKANIEKTTDLVSEVRDIHGGVWHYLPDWVPSQFFLPGDYNQLSPLEQYKSQQPLGRQTLLQLETQTWVDIFEVGDVVSANYREEGVFYPGKIWNVNPGDGTFDIDYDDGESEAKVKRSSIRKTAPSKGHMEPTTMTEKIVKEALESTISLMKSDDMSSVEVKEFTDVGDGSVLVGTWSGGTVVVLWDGRIHLDINLFTYTQDVAVANAFLRLFKDEIPNLNQVLRDDQPRGFGRVVNFEEDIDREADPSWAIFK